MTKADLVAYLLADTPPRDRVLISAGVEAAVEDLFARRGNPRSIMAPLAVNLARVRELKAAT